MKAGRSGNFFTELAKKLGIGDMFAWQSEEELVAFELGPTGLTFEQLLNDKPEGAYFKDKHIRDGRGRIADGFPKI